MNCKVVLRFLLYLHSRPPASIFPFYPHFLNLISPLQTHPAAFSCCQIPLSLPVLFYSNIFPPINSIPGASCVLPCKAKARQGTRILLPGIRRFERTQLRRFQNAPKALCFLCLDAKTLIFQITAIRLDHRLCRWFG